MGRSLGVWCCPGRQKPPLKLCPQGSHGSRDADGQRRAVKAPQHPGHGPGLGAHCKCITTFNTCSSMCGGGGHLSPLHRQQLEPRARRVLSKRRRGVGRHKQGERCPDANVGLSHARRNRGQNRVDGRWSVACRSPVPPCPVPSPRDRLPLRRLRPRCPEDAAPLPLGSPVPSSPVDGLFGGRAGCGSTSWSWSFCGEEGGEEPALQYRRMQITPLNFYVNSKNSVLTS